MRRETILTALLLLASTLTTTFGAAGAPWDTLEITEDAAFQEGSAEDSFGSPLDIDGDWLAIASPLDNEGTLEIDLGSVHLFTRDGTEWVHEVRLLPPESDSFVAEEDHREEDGFGFSIDLDGDYLAVGQPWADAVCGQEHNCSSGEVDIYRWNGVAWRLSAQVEAEDISARDHFGASVSLEGDRLLVGAPGKHLGSSLTGAAYVFERLGRDWNQVAQLTPENLTHRDGFGSAVALSGDTALVGSPRDDPGCEDTLHCNKGAVYAFTTDGNDWMLQERIFRSDGIACDRFGASLVLDGDAALVNDRPGHPGCPGSVDRARTVSVLERTGSTWDEVVRLSSPEASDDDRFGAGLALADGVAVVGDPTFNESVGGVHVHLASAGWTSVLTLTPEDGTEGDRFGEGVTLDDVAIVAGSPRHDGGGSNAGKAYLYSFDTDGDGLSDSTERGFGSDPLLLDTDGDGIPDPGEAENGTAPDNPDTDGDGLDDKTEVDGDTEPDNPDSDGDGLDDKTEVDGDTEPDNPDSDGDGVDDGTEVEEGTDPTDRDTDDDGFQDGAERNTLGSDPTDPTDPSPVPIPIP